MASRPGPTRWSSPPSAQLGQARQRMAGLRSGAVDRRPGREHQRDRLGQQAAPDEPEHLGRGLVQPLRVVHHAQQRLLLGRLGHQAERGQGDQELVGAVAARPSPNATLSPRRCGSASAPSPPSSGAHSWCSPAKASSISDSTPAARATRKPGGLGNQGAQQRGLADARLAPHHHDGALAVAHVGDELPEDLQLIDSAEQPGAEDAHFTDPYVSGLRARA